MSTAQTPASAPAAVSVPRLAAVTLLLVAGAAAVYFWVSNTQGQVPDVDYAALIRSYEERSADRLRMDQRYTDSDGDLVADAPKDGKFLDPETLVFSGVPGDSPEKLAADYKDLIEALAKATGKKVEYDLSMRGTRQQIEALREQKLHITAYNTGLVQEGVNAAGFQPVCVPAAADGSFGVKMMILVPEKSDIKTLADVRGRTFTFTTMGSNTGFKRPIVTLFREAKLLPGNDYTFTMSGGHGESIKGVVKGQFGAVSTVDDLLKRAEAEGKGPSEGEKKKEPVEGRYRAVYESKDDEKFPPLCWGTCHALKPELAQKIKDTFLNFKFEGTSLEKFKTSNQVKYVPVNYKDAWKIVRETDEALVSLGKQK